MNTAELVERLLKIKGSNVGIFIASTGAGAGIQERLWRMPGSSSYLASAIFPYDQNELTDFIGYEPEKFCSEDTAIDMAMAAYVRAKAVNFAKKLHDRPGLGLGLTASVASDREHRGDHRIHLAIVTDHPKAPSGCVTMNLTLSKGVGIEVRERDGHLADYIAIEAIGQVLGHGFNIKPGDTAGAEHTSFNVADHHMRHSLLTRSLFHPNGRREKPNVHQFYNDGVALFPGSFNPPHVGHIGMAEEVEEKRPSYTVNRPGEPVPYGYTAKKVIFALNLDYPINKATGKPNKEPMNSLQALDRVAYFRLAKNNLRPLLITTDQALYADKARAFAKIPYVIGMDTIERIFEVDAEGNPVWGDLNPIQLCQHFKDCETRFLYFTREKYAALGTILTRAIVHDAWSFEHLFLRMTGVWPVSSSEIRASRAPRTPPLDPGGMELRAGLRDPSEYKV
jgi:nicotinic acid mononucleotide adenylyltransferase